MRTTRSERWGLLELADAGVAVLDCEHKTPPDAGYGHPYIAIPNLVDGTLVLTNVRRITDEHLRAWTRRTRPRAGDIIVTRRARVGDTAVVPDGLDCAIGQNLVILRSDGRDVDQCFLRYATRGPLWGSEVNRLRNVGAVFDSLNVRDIARIRIPIPLLADQRAIAAILGALDDKIDSNRWLASLLEQTAAELFRARFVDFVGVEEFEDSEIGRIPRGWRVAPFCDAVQINPAAGLKRGETGPFIEMSAVDPWAVRPSKLATRPFSGGCRFEPGDTLMARITGCIEHGKGAFLDFIDEPGSGSTEFLVLRSKSPLTPEAVFLLSRAERVRAHAIANMTGSSGRQRVAMSCFRDLRVALPPDTDCWRGDSAALRSLLAHSRALWLESRSLAAFRDALLPKLISGAIRVPATGDPAEVIEPARAELAAIKP